MQWEGLEFYLDDKLDGSDTVGGAGDRWHKVLLPQKKIVNKWPSRSATVRMEKNCMRRLVELMRASLDNPRPRSEVKKQYFPDVPDRMLERAWSNAAVESGAAKWSQGGRRPNNRRA
jgi:hypothetical protein